MVNTITLNPLMSLDIWHTRTIWIYLYFKQIVSCRVVIDIYLLSTYPYHPLKYSYDFPNYNLILF